MKRSELLAAMAMALTLGPEPGQRKRRRKVRRARPRRHPGNGLKTRCRTLERYRDERAYLGPVIVSRFAIRAKALRALLRAAGHHVEPMPEVDTL